uniref:Uncharacterized protein n=1 Tax=Parascaris equorum TaxID=6256 RepID=A0A914RCK9_PAREQ
MSHLAEVYLVSNSDILGTSSIPLGQLQFPSLDYDFTIHLFYTESQNGAEVGDHLLNFIEGSLSLLIVSGCIYASGQEMNLECST